MAETPVTTTVTPTAEETAIAEVKERKRKELLYAKLRQRMGTSKLQVTAPSGYTPYWARKDDTSEMARLDYLGFRIVKEDPTQPKRYKAQGGREDGTYVMGDVILMEIHTEEYDFYLQENFRRSSSMTASVQAKFKEDAEKVGAPTFEIKRKA